MTAIVSSSFLPGLGYSRITLWNKVLVCEDTNQVIPSVCEDIMWHVFFADSYLLTG